MADKEVKSCVEDSDDSQHASMKVYVLVIYTGGTIGMKESPNGKS